MIKILADIFLCVILAVVILLLLFAVVAAIVYGVHLLKEELKNGRD